MKFCRAMIDVVVAGGQRGADLGALRAAAALRLETRGYMPRDFETEDGPAPHIAALYRLLQSDGGYAVRDRQNVDIVGVDGDGAGLFLGFLLRLAPMGRGTQQTLAYALTGEYAMPPPSLFEPVEGADVAYVRDGEREVLVVWDLSAATLEAAAAAVRSRCEDKRVLFVNGPCESTRPGIERLVQECVERALAR